MVATNDFSGLTSWAWALASAAAMVPILSLERCMAALHLLEIKADGTRFGTPRSNAMANCLPWHPLALAISARPSHAHALETLDGYCGRLQQIPPRNSRRSCRRSAPLRYAAWAVQHQTVEGARRSQRSARTCARR